MSLGFTSYIVENDDKIARAFKRAADSSKNLKIPFSMIARDFRKSRKAIFNLKGPGGYPDLSEKYKETKRMVLGEVYPILRLSGDLERSVTEQTDSHNITRINTQSLTMGTSIPYANFHQQDGNFTNTGKMPLRKFLFVGPESVKFASSEISGFPQRALNTLNTYILRELGASMEAATGVKPKIKKRKPKL